MSWWNRLRGCDVGLGKGEEEEGEGSAAACGCHLLGAAPFQDVGMRE
jgi:hypothetical protein